MAIHPTAIVSPDARIGAGVTIGAYSQVHGNVDIGEGSTIGSYCEIGYPTKAANGRPLVIGRDAHIRSHSVFYEGSTFGPGLVTGHHVTVREHTEVGCHFQLGLASEIQGDCTIGDYVRTQSNVFIGKATKIGNFVWLFPYVVLTNDPTPPSNLLLGCELGDFAAIAAKSVILPGVKVGEHTLVAANSTVIRDVAAHTVVGGSPAKFICNADQVRLRDGSGRAAYPWTSHFHRGYPEHIVATWLAAASGN